MLEVLISIFIRSDIISQIQKIYFIFLNSKENSEL